MSVWGDKKMNSQEILRKIMKEAGITQKRLAEMTRRKSQNNIQQLMRSVDIKVGRLDELLRAMGYKVIVVKADAEIGEGYDLLP